MDEIKKASASETAPDSEPVSSPKRPSPEDASSEPKVSLVSLFTLAPVALALLTAMFFLTGRAYWMGYLSHFNLEPTLFSDDLSNQATRSVAAWIQAFATATDWLREHFVRALPIIMLIPAAILFVLCVAAGVLRGTKAAISWLFGGVAHRFTNVRRHPSTRAIACFLRKWFAPPIEVKFVMRGVAWVYLVPYALSVSFWVVSLALILLVGPFNNIGESAAAHDQTDGFSKSPVIRIPVSGGEPGSYRLILCAPRYCALYDGKRAISVLASAVTRAESPEPATGGQIENSSKRPSM